MGAPLLNHLILKLLLLLLPVILLLSTSFLLQSALVEGRTLKVLKEEEEEKTMMAKPLMGSRPPRCEKRCPSCGHCEAVQVPVVPFAGIDFLRASSSGVDFSSNYKPMKWKCKCGNMIFNP